MMTEQIAGGSYDYADEFDYGLDLVLDGLEERLARVTDGRSTDERSPDERGTDDTGGRAERDG